MRHFGQSVLFCQVNLLFFHQNPRDFYLVGNTVEYSCIDGHYLSGEAVAVCTENHQWQRGAMVCKSTSFFYWTSQGLIVQFYCLLVRRLRVDFRFQLQLSYADLDEDACWIFLCTMMFLSLTNQAVFLVLSYSKLFLLSQALYAGFPLSMAWLQPHPPKQPIRLERACPCPVLQSQCWRVRCQKLCAVPVCSGLHRQPMLIVKPVQYVSSQY